MFLNKSNFSDIAENNNIINSQIKNKHLLEKINSLKEKGQLIDQMKQKMAPIYTIPINQNYKNIQNKSIKSKIIENHAIRLTNYYDYLPNETDKKINELLEEINYFGEITEKEIREEEKLNPSNQISIHEALELGKNSNHYGYKNEYYILALLAQSLSSQGCSVLIERNGPNDNEGKNEIFTTIQFLANGMYNFHKYIFYFNFVQQIDKILCNNVNERNNFNIKLKNKLLLLFNLKENDILLTNPTFFPYTITAIIKKSQYNGYSPEILLNTLNTEFNTLIDIKKKILLSGCKLNKYMLDYRGNNNDRGWGQNEMRGGAPYYPPKGWVGYGLRVADRYDKGNNAWIDYNNSKGEWSVAYHGIGYGSNIIKLLGKNNNTILAGINHNFKHYKDLFHFGQKVGEGIIVTPKPQVLERHCAIIDCYGIKYKIGFMTRVMPFKIRCAQGQDNYWIINGTDNEIRPYRILIKEL